MPYKNVKNNSLDGSIKIRKVANRLEAFNRITKTWSKLKLAGFNHTEGDQSFVFDSPFATLTNQDNPLLNTLFYKATGQDNGDNSDLLPLKMNFMRSYVAPGGNSTIVLPNGQEAIEATAEENYFSDVLYFHPIKDLNINVTSMPTVNVTYTTALSIDKIGDYKVLVQQANGRLGNTGIVTAIVAYGAASWGITTDPTVTISGGGLANPVVIPANKILRRKQSIITCNIDNKGFGYKYSDVSSGLATYTCNNQFEIPYFSMIEGGITKISTDTVEPMIFGRVQHLNNIIPISGAMPTAVGFHFDYYTNHIQNWDNRELNKLHDCFILDGGEFMPGGYTRPGKKLRSPKFDPSNLYNQVINGAAYNYNFEAFKGYSPTFSSSQLQIKTFTNSDIEYQYNTCKKYGIVPMYNFWFAFKPWNMGGYAVSQVERAQQAKRSKAEYKTWVQRRCIDIKSVTGDDTVLIILGNESNLTYMLEGVDYSTGSPTYGQNIFWADPANPQNEQKNVEEMIRFFDLIIKDLKVEFGDKFLFCQGLQYADDGRCEQIETAFSLGLLDNTDILGNNYYGNKTTVQPWINNGDLNVFTRYQANVPLNKRIPMMLLETGSPSIIYANTSGGNPLNYETEQGDIMKNMLKVLDLYEEVSGVLLFGFWNQPSRGDKFLLAEWDGFNFPRKASNPAQVTHFNEKDMGIMNFPIYNATGINEDFANIPSHAEFLALAKDSLAIIRTEMNTREANPATRLTKF